MKVKDLIFKLSKMDQNADVIISIDEEGNEFNKGLTIEEDIYFESDGEICICGEDVEDELKKCVIIWP